MKKPIYLYIELFMCCLTYSYIAILYSICQCTVPNLLSRKKKRRKGEKKISDTANGTDRTRPVEERRNRVSLRKQEAAGSRAESVVF